MLEDKGSAPCDYCISIVCKLIFVRQIINGTVNTFKSFEWFESSGEQREASELGVGCRCVHGHDDATTSVLHRLKLGHDGCGPTAEICTPTQSGIRRQIVIAESVANWLGESHYIGGFRIHSSDSRARQAKNIEALVFHHMQFFGGQDNIDTIRRNSNEAILNANQLVLRLASQVQVAETRIQELEASLMAAQKMSAAHDADSNVWERKALDEKDKNISEIHKIGDSLHRNNGHA